MDHLTGLIIINITMLELPGFTPPFPMMLCFPGDLPRCCGSQVGSGRARRRPGGTLRPSLAELLHPSAPGFFPLRLLGSAVRLDSVESVGPQRPVLLTWHSAPLCEMLCKLKANFEQIPFKSEEKKKKKVGKCKRNQLPGQPEGSNQMISVKY